jgi:hypothetical protein
MSLAFIEHVRTLDSYSVDLGILENHVPPTYSIANGIFASLAIVNILVTANHVHHLAAQITLGVTGFDDAGITSQPDQKTDKHVRWKSHLGSTRG